MKRLVLVLLFIVVFGVVFTSGVFGFGDSEDPESNEWDAGEPHNWKYRYLYYDYTEKKQMPNFDIKSL